MALPAAAFFTRWMTHICAPTFVFLAGSVARAQRRAADGEGARPPARSIETIVTRGAIIALLDLTLVSFGSGYLNFGVLFAIGVSDDRHGGAAPAALAGAARRRRGVVCRRRGVTGLLWHPPGSASPLVALTVATDSGGPVVIKYAVLPWLAMMAMGWAFGQHISRVGGRPGALLDDTRSCAVGGVLLPRRLRRRALERRATATCSCTAPTTPGSSGCTSASTRRR